MTVDYRVALPAWWVKEAGADVRQILGEEAEVVDLGPSELARGDPVCQALVLTYAHCDAALMDRFPRLRLVAMPGTGVWDYVDLAAAARRGVAVANIVDYATASVAELCMGLMVAAARRVAAADRAVRRGEWDPPRFRGMELAGRTLGLVGLGSIGARVAELARAFRMEVLCHTLHPHPDRAARHGVVFVDLATLLRQADVISLHAALTHATRHLLGVRELALVKPGAILVNTARGGLVDTAALTAALEDGRLAAAALDVTDPEPLPPGHPLLSHDHVIVTPHIGALTGAALRRSAEETLANVREFFAGRPRNVVNPEALTVRR